MNISIFGLGYVGAVSAACLAGKGHSVWGVDINADKVNLIKGGSSPIVEPGLNEKITAAVRSKKLIATTDHKEALSHSEISIIAVATPSRSSGQIDSAHLLRACEQIASGLRDLNRKQCVVIRSSVLPSIFRECKKTFDDHAPGLVELCANPEFLREGSAIEDFEHPPYTIIGTTDKETERMLRSLYADIDAPIHVLSAEEAIMIKYASNAYHGLKVAFGNEIGALCKAQGINGTNVMKVFSQDTKLNISSKYLLPGFAFGGSCLPKDIRAVTYAAKSLDIELPMLESIIPSNEHVIGSVLKRIQNYGKKRIGLIGLSFKENTDDLRESPFVELSERLIGKGVDLKIYDPNVLIARLTGANKTFIEEVIPHISNLLVNSIDDVTRHSELIVVGHKFKEVNGLTGKLLPSTIIFDLCNVTELRSHQGIYDGIGW